MKNSANEKERKEKQITMQALAMQPPSFEEVKEKCREIDVLFDPSYFFDYYTARGWRDRNGIELVDLSAALRSWIRREFKYPKNQGKVQQTSTGSSIDKDALDAYISGQFVDGEDKV